MIGYSFGLHVVSPGVLRVYEKDVYLITLTHGVKSGSYVGLAARNATASVGRFEAWSAPDGSLIWADEFESLAGWTDAWEGGGWSASSGRAVASAAHNDTSSVIVRPMNSAGYFVIRDLDFSSGDAIDRWVMIDAFRGVTGRSDVPDDQSWKGYRLYVRDNEGPIAPITMATQHLASPNQTGSYIEKLGPVGHMSVT